MSKIFDKDPQPDSTPRTLKVELTQAQFNQAINVSFTNYTVPRIYLTKNQARDIRRWAGPGHDEQEFAGVNRLLVESFCAFLTAEWEKILDIRQVVTDNAMKDMQEEDKKFMQTVNVLAKIGGD